MVMACANVVHVSYWIGLVSIQFYLLNRHDSKKLVEYCLKEGWLTKDFTHVYKENEKIEKIRELLALKLQDIINLSGGKPILIHMDRVMPIMVNISGKGLMAAIEILMIGDE